MVSCFQDVNDAHKLGVFICQFEWIAQMEIPCPVAVYHEYQMLLCAVMLKNQSISVDGKHSNPCVYFYFVQFLD